MKNLFDLPQNQSIVDEIQDAGTWAKRIINKVLQDEADKWIDFPLIQRDPIALGNDHKTIYRHIRSNPTADLFQLCIISGHDENKFFKIINDLVRDNYLRILSTYFSLDINKYIEPLFQEFLRAKAEARAK